MVQFVSSATRIDPEHHRHRDRLHTVQGVEAAHTDLVGSPVGLLVEPSDYIAAIEVVDSLVGYCLIAGGMPVVGKWGLRPWTAWSLEPRRALATRCYPSCVPDPVLVGLHIWLQRHCRRRCLCKAAS